ncbi:MAG TPA: pentapeptide repeat-containing protein, partial [Dongiaceae bacterium]
MADEAFALSPISARATLPSEEDYAAIAEAFMETSRGRWFLTEYAKRNRNADTRMVLDAVARIEQSLSAQREETLEREASLQREEGLSAQQAAEAVAAAAAAQERLTEALAAIRNSVEAAEESAVEALDSLALEQRLAPVRKGARVLREIAWRLREIGNDGRICDLIDSQVTVIEKGTDQFSSEEARVALRAAFAALQGRLVEFSDEDRALATAAETEAAATSPAAPEMPPAGEKAETVLPEEAAETPSASRVRPAEAAPAAVETVPTQTATPPAAEVAAAAVQEAAVQNADPQYTDFQDADFQDADFEDADFRDADFRDADFRDA